MTQYVDTFVFPIHTDHVNDYKKAAEAVAKIWIEHGALTYQEFIGNDLRLEGPLHSWICLTPKRVKP